MAANDIARVYAHSLVEVGQDNNILAAIEEEMKFVSDLFTEDQELRQYFASPGFSKESKKEFVKKIFGGKLSDQIVSLFNVLIENDRQLHVNDIYDAMVELIDEVNNRMRVTVVTTEKLSDSMRDKIVSELSNKFKKEIILNVNVDEKIIGGIIIKVGDLVIDGSLSKDLKNIQKNLLNSKVRSEVAYED